MNNNWFSPSFLPCARLSVITFSVGLLTIVGGVSGWSGSSLTGSTDEQASCMAHSMVMKKSAAWDQCHLLDR